MHRSRKPVLAAGRTTRIPANYPALLEDIKKRIRSAQVRATLSANAELIHLYWDIGQTICHRQKREGWGAGVIPRLASDLHAELPEVKGFSERNIGRMIAFYRAYPTLWAILPQAAAKLPPRRGSRKAPLQPAVDAPPLVPQLAAQLPWFHHVILLEKVKHLPTRLWYMRETLAQGWSRNVLALQIAHRAHLRQGRAVTNFPATLPPPQSDLAVQTLKDPCPALRRSRPSCRPGPSGPR